MKNDPTAAATMDYELMRERAEIAEARVKQLESENSILKIRLEGLDHALAIVDSMNGEEAEKGGKPIK